MGKFPERLKELREEKNLSRNQLGQKIGISNSVISAWELGKKQPLMESIITLCNFFNCSAGYLIGLED